jgi:hypothetical protein
MRCKIQRVTQRALANVLLAYSCSAPALAARLGTVSTALRTRVSYDGQQRAEAGRTARGGQQRPHPDSSNVMCSCHRDWGAGWCCICWARWRHQRLSRHRAHGSICHVTGLCGSGVKSLRRGSAGRPTGGTCTTSLTSSTPALTTSPMWSSSTAPSPSTTAWTMRRKSVGAVLACPGRGATLRWRSAAMKSLASARWSCCAGVRAPPALHGAPGRAVRRRARVDRQPPQCRGGAEMRSTHGARR